MQQLADVKPFGSSPISERTFADLLSPLIEPGLRLAVGMLHDPSAAEDAVQEASFTAWRKVQVDGDGFSEVFFTHPG
jgi:DNA-directed RNA polymerase specialized sigma24 family protein